MFTKDLGRRLVTIGIGLALVAPAGAWAQSPVTDTYGGTGDVLNEVVDGEGVGPGTAGGDDGGDPTVTQEAGAGTPTTTASGGSLPFTGLDVGLLIGGGLTMLGFGVLLRRLSRSSV